ncbi:BT4734/BF3469 family protein [Halocola ammonii]
MTRLFSFYPGPIGNTTPSKHIGILDIYHLIKGGDYERTINNIRNQRSKEAKRMLKTKNLDFVTFSGTFHKRSKSGLFTHSGMICFDFDNFRDSSEVLAAKEALLKENELQTELLFTSPSGLGLKWVVSDERINQDTHEKFFVAISAMLKARYNLEVDQSGKDISRACFLSHDPFAYINLKYLDHDIK